MAKFACKFCFERSEKFALANPNCPLAKSRSDFVSSEARNSRSVMAKSQNNGILKCRDS